MGLHIYCIVPAGHAVPGDCRGLDGKPPVVVEAGTLALWASEHDSAVPVSVDAVRIHNDVVRAGMTPSVTPVPMRFGQWFASRDEAVERVIDDTAKWTGLLGRFAGHAEYGVRALSQGVDAERDVHPAPPQSGKDYMAGLARKQAQAASRRDDGERIASAIRARLGDLAVAERVDYIPADDVLVTFAHLVAWDAADEYHDAIREFCDSGEGVSHVLSGPWPPYSFVE
jgi:hypothetical protein